MNPDMQWATLLWMLLAGTSMGIVYDSCRVLSLNLRFPRWLNAAVDLLYWLVSALFVFRMLYAGNQGQLRFYVFLGLFLGVWIYFLIFSVKVRGFVVMLIQAFRFMCRLLLRILDLLVAAPLRLLWRLTLFLLGLVGGLLSGILKLLLRIFRPLWARPVAALRRRLSGWKQPEWIGKCRRWLAKRRKR